MHLPRVLPTVRCGAVHQPGRTVPGADEAATHALVQVGYAEWALLVEATRDVDACVAAPPRSLSHSLPDSVSTPNSRPEHGWMSGSGDQIAGGT
jgi:hypothetical protein